MFIPDTKQQPISVPCPYTPLVGTIPVEPILFNTAILSNLLIFLFTI